MGGCRSNFILFLKTKEAKPPSMKPPPKTRSQRYLCCDRGTIWAAAAVAADLAPLHGTRFSHAQIGGWSGWVPLQCYLAVRTLPTPRVPQIKVVSVPPFVKILSLVILPAARVVCISPFQCSFLLLHVYQYWLVSLKFVQKMWQFILLIYLQLLLFIHSFPYWSKLWASLSQWEFCRFLSSGQDFLCHLQIPSWTCSPFCHLCLLWNLLPILLKYSFFFFQCPSP